MSNTLAPPQPQFSDPVERYARIMETMKVRLQTGLKGMEEHAGGLVDGIFANQHVLLEGIPGTGKTKMIKNLGKLIIPEDDTATLSRFQGNRDSLPSDVLGGRIFNQATGKYEFEEGPIFAHFMQADELNRNDTRTQAGLNQALEEREITVGGKTYVLPRPALTLATQNSYAFGQATQRTDDSLVDRFGTSIVFERPHANERDNVQAEYAKRNGEEWPDPYIPVSVLKSLMAEVSVHTLEESANKRITDIIEATIDHSGMSLVSDGYRPGLSAVSLAQAHAMRNGKPTTTIESVNAVMPGVLSHRVATIGKKEAGLDASREIIEDIIKRTA